MRWVVVLTLATVAGGVVWWTLSGPLEQGAEVTATIAVAVGGAILATLTQWANGSRRPVPATSAGSASPATGGETVVDGAESRRRSVSRERVETVATAVRRLAEAPRTTENRYCIVEVDGIEGFYAQFMRSDVGVWVELESSNFLAPRHRLSPQREGWLREHGWNVPDDHSPNFYRDFRVDDLVLHSRDVGRAVVDALDHAYGIHETDPIVVRYPDDR